MIFILLKNLNQNRSLTVNNLYDDDKRIDGTGHREIQSQYQSSATSPNHHTNSRTGSSVFFVYLHVQKNHRG